MFHVFVFVLPPLIVERYTIIFRDGTLGLNIYIYIQGNDGQTVSVWRSAEGHHKGKELIDWHSVIIIEPSLRVMNSWC